MVKEPSEEVTVSESKNLTSASTANMIVAKTRETQVEKRIEETKEVRRSIEIKRKTTEMRQERGDEKTSTKRRMMRRGMVARMTSRKMSQDSWNNASFAQSLLFTMLLDLVGTLTAAGTVYSGRK